MLNSMVSITYRPYTLCGMSVQIKFDNHTNEEISADVKVKVTDLLSRLKKEKKIEKKRNLALGVAAFSAVTVFGIILTI